MFYHESWQNDICSFRAMTVALTVSFKVIVFNIYICSFLECHLMGQIKVNLYSIVTLKLKSCLKDFNLRVTMYVFA